LFASAKYIYRVFVTDRKEAIDLLVWFYNQRAGAENLIKEANNDAGLAAHPSARWAANCVHFQLAMLAYNLNCWLLLFNREEKVQADDLKHTTLVTARLGFLFVAAKIGGTPGESASATAISIRSADCCSGSWIGCGTLPWAQLDSGRCWPRRSRASKCVSA
jgi:hypothetical protein